MSVSVLVAGFISRKGGCYATERTAKDLFRSRYRRGRESCAQVALALPSTPWTVFVERARASFATRRGKSLAMYVRNRCGGAATWLAGSAHHGERILHLYRS